MSGGCASSPLTAHHKIPNYRQANPLQIRPLSVGVAVSQRPPGNIPLNVCNLKEEEERKKETRPLNPIFS